MIILQMFLVIFISIMAPLIWLTYFSEMRTSKFNAKMEKINIDHARDMQKIQNLAPHLYTDADHTFIVTYLVPVQNQPLWVRWLNRIKIYPYTFVYNAAESKLTQHQHESKYTKTISKNKWFYMQLKNWSETNDRKAALEAMQYLHWERDIP